MRGSSDFSPERDFLRQEIQAKMEADQRMGNSIPTQDIPSFDGGEPGQFINTDAVRLVKFRSQIMAEREAQLYDFYMQVAPENVGKSRDVAAFSMDDFAGVRESLQQAYGSVPQGWEYDTYDPSYMWSEPEGPPIPLGPPIQLPAPQSRQRVKEQEDPCKQFSFFNMFGCIDADFEPQHSQSRHMHTPPTRNQPQVEAKYRKYNLEGQQQAERVQRQQHLQRAKQLQQELQRERERLEVERERERLEVERERERAEQPWM